jgi:hypothetical protein
MFPSWWTTAPRYIGLRIPRGANRLRFATVRALISLSPFLAVRGAALCHESTPLVPRRDRSGSRPRSALAMQPLDSSEDGK